MDLNITARNLINAGLNELPEDKIQAVANGCLFVGPKITRAGEVLEDAGIDSDEWDEFMDGLSFEEAKSIGKIIRAYAGL